MFASVVLLAVILTTAWALSRLVDRCYRVALGEPGVAPRVESAHRPAENGSSDHAHPAVVGTIMGP